MRRYLLILWAVVLVPAVEASTWNVQQINGRRYVPVKDVAAFYRMQQTVSTANAFTLTSTGRTIRGTSGKREVLINGVKYVLCFPLVSRNNTVYVSAMDVTKIIEPIMRPGRIKDAAPVKTVILDPGHGGHDSGAVGPRGKEKNFALDVALRARALLVRAGYDVKMTRTNDTFVELHDRSKFANRHPDAIFISIHFNKSRSGGGTGVETFALAPRGVPSMDEENLSYSDFKHNPGNDRDSENIALAATMHTALVRNLRLPDRGIKRARFHVIREIKIPGVLIEGGFMDHANDARMIADPDFRQRMALSILQAVNSYAQAVTGAAPQSTPTLVVSGDKPSSIPPLDGEPEKEAAIGARTGGIDRAVEQVDIGGQTGAGSD